MARNKCERSLENLIAAARFRASPRDPAPAKPSAASLLALRPHSPVTVAGVCDETLAALRALKRSQADIEEMLRRV